MYDGLALSGLPDPASTRPLERLDEEIEDVRVTVVPGGRSDKRRACRPASFRLVDENGTLLAVSPIENLSLAPGDSLKIDFTYTVT